MAIAQLVTSLKKVIPWLGDENGVGYVTSLGLVDGALQRNPIAFGYSGQVLREWQNTDLPTGNSAQSDSAVPAGEIWVVTNISFVYVGTAPTSVQINLVGSATVALFRTTGPVSATMYDRQGYWILIPTDYLSAAVTGATLHDDIFAYASGFRVDIDQ